MCCVFLYILCSCDANDIVRNITEFTWEISKTVCHKKKSYTISINLCSIFSISFFHFFLDGYSDIEARLVVRKYIEKGSGVTLYCEHNVDPKILYKVSIPTGICFMGMCLFHVLFFQTSGKLEICSREFVSQFCFH